MVGKIHKVMRWDVQLFFFIKHYNMLLLFVQSFNKINVAQPQHQSHTKSILNMRICVMYIARI